MKQISLNTILFCVFTLLSLKAEAQTFIGISANVGNRVRYTPASGGLKRPVSLSGSLVVNVRKELKNNWILIGGANAGIIGYTIKVRDIDTLNTASGFSDSYPFYQYDTFYGSLNAVIARNLSLGKRKLLFGLGGGAGYAYSGWYTTYGVTASFANGTDTEQFYAWTSPKNGVTAFAKAVTQFPVNRFITLGLEYSRHFSSILEGEYEFYHTKTPSAGKISLYQSELSLVCLVRVSRQ